MVDSRFAHLLQQMPAIAEAVNVFQSEKLQQAAFERLVAALEQELGLAPGTFQAAGGSEDRPTGGAKPAKNAAKPANALSTAEILAQARGQGAKSDDQAATPAKQAAPAKQAVAEKQAAPAKQAGPDKKISDNGQAAAEQQPAAGAPNDRPLGDPAKPSDLEEIKETSGGLRGEIGEELARETDHFGKRSIQVLKHHGTYQQDDRDARGKGGGKKSGKSYMFMVRTKIPGGKLTSDQLLSEIDLGDEVGNSTLRITSRQGLQLHGVVKNDLQRTIGRINEVQLSTLGACGDVNRNVMCCPAPHRNDPVHDQMQVLADELAAHFAPRTTAYHELWLRDLAGGEEDQLVGGGKEGHEIEPIYGKHYLPRKFKIAVGLPGDNCVDMYTHDLALMTICDGGKIAGYNILVGGGQGVTPSAKKTFPALGHKLTFVSPEQALELATAVVKVQRDFGNRSDRKTARLKYLIHEWGLPRFKAKVEEYFGSKLPAPHEADVHGFDDHLGWHKQGDGKWFYGLNIENGRIKDADGLQLKSALREICSRHQPGIRLTSHQSMLLTDVSGRNKTSIEEVLRKHNVKLSEDISSVRRWSMACVAWPTCGLAITESERALPGVIDQLEPELAKLGLAAEQFTVRMTGCPNGCARPYNSDVGLVGKTAGKYTVFLGGRLLGDRLNFLYKDLVPGEELVSTLVPVFAYFKQDRHPEETFGDFCHRKGQADLAAWADQYAAQMTP